MVRSRPRHAGHGSGSRMETPNRNIIFRLGVRSRLTASEAGAMVQPITVAPSIRVPAVFDGALGKWKDRSDEPRI